MLRKRNPFLYHWNCPAEGSSSLHGLVAAGETEGLQNEVLSWYNQVSDQLMGIRKGKIWDAETQKNSSAKPQRSHWEEHWCGLGFSPKSPFAILEAALIMSYMCKGSEGKGLSVNISYLSLLLRMHFNPGLHHSKKYKYMHETLPRSCNF